MQEVLSESSCDAKADNISGNKKKSKDKNVWFETLWQSGNKYFPTIYSVTSSLKEVKGGTLISDCMNYEPVACNKMKIS